MHFSRESSREARLRWAGVSCLGASATARIPYSIAWSISARSLKSTNRSDRQRVTVANKVGIFGCSWEINWNAWIWYSIAVSISSSLPNRWNRSRYRCPRPLSTSFFRSDSAEVPPFAKGKHSSACLKSSSSPKCSNRCLSAYPRLSKHKAWSLAPPLRWIIAWVWYSTALLMFSGIPYLPNSHS